MVKVRKKISYVGEKIYVGIDVHKRQWTICCCTSETNFRPFVQLPDAELLIQYLHRTFPGAEFICGYEAGFSGYDLYERLSEAQIRCLVIHASDIPTSQKESEFKTDPRDALKIAKALRAGDVKSIAIPDKQLQEDRTLIRFRQQLRRDLVRQKCRIKSILHFYNIPMDEELSKGQWTKKLLSCLWNLELVTQEGTKALHLHMGMLTYIIGMCKNTDNHMRELSRQARYEKQVDLLMTVPGFGRRRSIEFLVCLGDIKRFKTLDKLCNYIGLIPSSSNSADKIKQKNLTRRGHKQLRTMMVEAAWVSMNTDPAMSLKYAVLKKRMLGQKAIISIARKLLNRVRYVLLHEVPYEKGIEA